MSGRKWSLFGRKESKKNTSVTYSAAHLHKKGVLLEIEGLPQTQFKNIVFTVNSTDYPGVFIVNAKFMGVAMDKKELIFQDLLQLESKGEAVIKMFEADKVKMNVSPLISLLNRKFYVK